MAFIHNSIHVRCGTTRAFAFVAVKSGNVPSLASHAWLLSVGTKALWGTGIIGAIDDFMVSNRLKCVYIRRLWQVTLARQQFNLPAASVELRHLCS